MTCIEVPAVVSIGSERLKLLDIFADIKSVLDNVELTGVILNQDVLTTGRKSC